MCTLQPELPSVVPSTIHIIIRVRLRCSGTPTITATHAAVPQLEILSALKKLGEQLTPEEVHFMTTNTTDDLRQFLQDDISGKAVHDTSSSGMSPTVSQNYNLAWVSGVENLSIKKP